MTEPQFCSMTYRTNLFFSLQGQIVTIFCFADNMISVETTQLDSFSVKAALDNRLMNVHGHNPIKFYLQK